MAIAVITLLSHRQTRAHAYSTIARDEVHHRSGMKEADVGHRVFGCRLDDIDRLEVVGVD